MIPPEARWGSTDVGLGLAEVDRIRADFAQTSARFDQRRASLSQHGDDVDQPWAVLGQILADCGQRGPIPAKFWAIST